MGRDAKTLLRNFHEARWDEPIIYEMSTPGERGVIPPKASEEIKNVIGEECFGIPAALMRKKAPELPEVGQMRVNRHYMRLSQEVLGDDVTVDMGQGTCTMKYSPKIQERTVNCHTKLVDIHPLQDERTIQGVLEVYYEVERYLKSISGMDYFTFQPGGGAHAVYANASIVRKYFRERGEEKEIINQLAESLQIPEDTAVSIIEVLIIKNKA